MKRLVILMALVLVVGCKESTAPKASVPIIPLGGVMDGRLTDELPPPDPIVVPGSPVVPMPLPTPKEK
jgi:hypothetical protein